jgi:Flp pilus assembly protein TadB
MDNLLLWLKVIGITFVVIAGVIAIMFALPFLIVGLVGLMVYLLVKADQRLTKEMQDELTSENRE